MSIVKNTIKEQVYREIRTRILHQQYAPGSFLNIVHLSREFEVSNSPIREALAMLEQEGLVTLAANSKFRVTDLDDEKMQELNTAMLTLMSGAVFLCARQGRLPGLARQLEEALVLQEKAEEEIQPEFRYEIALGFDRAIVTATENELLIRTFDNWYNLLFLSTSLLKVMSEDSLAEHRQILAAVREEEIRRIMKALEVHYDKHLHD